MESMGVINEAQRQLRQSAEATAAAPSTTPASSCRGICWWFTSDVMFTYVYIQEHQGGPNMIISKMRASLTEITLEMSARRSGVQMQRPGTAQGCLTSMGKIMEWIYHWH